MLRLDMYVFRVKFHFAIFLLIKQKMDFKFGNSISGFLYSYLVLLLTYTEVNMLYFRISNFVSRLYFGLFVYYTSCELYNFTYEIRV